MIKCSSRKINKTRVPSYWGLKIVEPKDLWFCDKIHKWKDALECSGFSCSTHANVHSVRDAKVHLRRHTELPKGTVAVLVGDNVEVILHKH